MAATKRCPRCKRRRRLASFHARRTSLDGRTVYCKDCVATYAYDWYRRNREEQLAKGRERQRTPRAKRQKREYHLRVMYGLSITEYEAMRRRQKGKCLICREYFGRKLVVDHDHETGRVRGLLCCRCNSDLGLFENPTIVARVLKYLAA